MSGLSIGEAVREILLRNEDLKAAVGDKIAPFPYTEDVSYPYVTYEILDVTPNYTKDLHPIDDTVTMKIEAVTETHAESIRLTEIVRSTLERKRGVYAGLRIRDIQVVGYAEAGQDASSKGLILEINCNNIKK